MILVDTSIWVDHLRTTDPALAQLLDSGAVLGHPWVTGELALGSIRQRAEIIGLLNGLPQATVATPAEVLTFIDDCGIHGTGIGYVDAQLLASARLTDANLWTRDRRLAVAADRVRVSAGPGAVPGPRQPGP